MTTIRLFRDVFLDGKKEEEYTDTRPNNETKPNYDDPDWLRKRINGIMDDCYNIGIDETIARVKKYYDDCHSICPETLIPYLSAIKKTPPKEPIH